MATKKRKNVAPADEPLQWSGLDRTGQAVLSTSMAGMGMVASKVEDRIAAMHLARSVTESPTMLHKLGVQTNAMEAVAPHVEDRPITMRGATQRRTKLLKQASEKSTGSTPEGTGWYFQHHAAIAAAATEHGFDPSTAITASAVMSPMNSPENEKASVTALMHGHQKGSVFVTPGAAKAAKLPKKMVGQNIALSDLSPEHIAAMSSTTVQAKLDERTNVDFVGIARGGTKENIVKAVSVLRGETPREEAINPHTSPKVWSYHNAIQNARPGTPEHEEYLTRVQHVLGGGQMLGHEPLDLFGLRSSREGILNPRGHTAEDTWMNTITFGQPDKMVGRGRTLVSKTIASDKRLGTGLPKTATGIDPTDPNRPVSAHTDSRIGGDALLHAYNNEATVRSAAQVSRGTGVELPSVAAQEISWTEKRRAVGKDPAFNQTQIRESKAAAPPPPQRERLF